MMIAAGLLPVALNRPRDEAEREMIYASILALHRDVREILAVLREGEANGMSNGKATSSAASPKVRRFGSLPK